MLIEIYLTKVYLTVPDPHDVMTETVTTSQLDPRSMTRDRDLTEYPPLFVDLYVDVETVDRRTIRS